MPTSPTSKLNANMKKTFKFAVSLNGKVQEKFIQVLATVTVISAATALLASHPDAVIVSQGELTNVEGGMHS